MENLGLHILKDVFAQRYREEYGEEPNVFAAYAHDAYSLLTAAVEAGARTRAELAENLGAVHLSEVVGPTRSFSPDRTPEHATRLQIVLGTEFVPLPASEVPEPTALR